MKLVASWDRIAQKEHHWREFREMVRCSYDVKGNERTEHYTPGESTTETADSVIDNGLHTFPPKNVSEAKCCGYIILISP